MNVTKTNIPGVLLFEVQSFGDARGFFMELYRRDRCQEMGIGEEFVQDNVSLSRRGVLRGLHFQKPPHAQGKLVSVLAGSIFDVAADIRPESPTYGRYFAASLSGENHKQLWIPAGLAHGFLALSGGTIVSYKCTDFYAPECDGGVRWDDPTLAIHWPLPKEEIIVSEKDAGHPMLGEIR